MTTSSVIAMGVASLVGVGFVIKFGLLSLLSGAIHFLFGGPTLTILKSSKGKKGLALLFQGDSANDQVQFDRLRFRCLNPFGTPSQLIIDRSFPSAFKDCLIDLDLGNEFEVFQQALEKDKNSLRVLIEFYATKTGICRSFEYSGLKFQRLFQKASKTLEDINRDSQTNETKPVFTIPSRNFIADPSVPKGDKKLKLASNPEFAEEMAASKQSEGAASGENFSVSKVWIESGCIICNQCDAIFPEVFDVQESGCIVKADAPMDNGKLIQEAAEACPVEIIKFTKA